MRTIALTVALTAAAAPCLQPEARAEEGMWTLGGFPSDRVEEEYGFGPSEKWLEHVRAASLRIAGGCSASFVSKKGLVLTNHHCVVSCVQQLSTPEDDLVKSGFYAEKQKDETECPGMEINRLESTTDVTKQVTEAIAGKTGQAYVDARKEVIARIEKACGGDADDKRCDVVSLYNGGLYHLYAYRRFQDVRLVFAPPQGIAFFGGDPDNFNFPRYVLDAAFVRVYDDGKPFRSKRHFEWSKQGPEAGELVFVSGHPGRTSRLDTVAQLKYARDIYYPERLMDLSEQHGLLMEFSRRSEEMARIAGTQKFRVENAIKAFRGRHGALVDEAFFSELVDAENEFRAKLKANDELWSEYGGAWDAIAEAMDRAKAMRFDVRYKAYPRFGSRLFGYALNLVRWEAEESKPNGERLSEYTESRLPGLKARLAAARPVYPELEIAQLGLELTQMRQDLGPDDPFVKAVLGPQSPYERAEELVKGSELADPALRMKLFEGGTDASADAMIQLARLVDPMSRETRKQYEREVDAVVSLNTEKIAAARFQLYGTELYPDATFSLRLTYGTVRGFPHRGMEVEPFTTVRGLYDRATGREPFRLPAEWKEKKDDLDPDQRMNFVSTNDIIGGNSGSPIFNRDLEIVGVIFDGNIYSLGGEYGFDIRNNRAISVHSGFIRMALEKVYGARRLVRELK
jgi:hypothetical protein